MLQRSQYSPAIDSPVSFTSLVIEAIGYIVLPPIHVGLLPLSSTLAELCELALHTPVARDWTSTTAGVSHCVDQRGNSCTWSASSVLYHTARCPSPPSALFPQIALQHASMLALNPRKVNSPWDY